MRRNCRKQQNSRESWFCRHNRTWPLPRFGQMSECSRCARCWLSATRYYQLLNALLDDPRALAHDPVTVNRLRRIRDARRARR